MCSILWRQCASGPGGGKPWAFPERRGALLVDRVRLERVLRYIFYPSLPLKHLSYVEATGAVRYAPPQAPAKVWSHAHDFLTDWVQHIPRAKQHETGSERDSTQAHGKQGSFNDLPGFDGRRKDQLNDSRRAMAKKARKAA